MHPPDGPPVCTAFTAFPPAPPLPISMTIRSRSSRAAPPPARPGRPCRRGRRPWCRRSPGPIAAYQPAPRLTITGTLHQGSRHCSGRSASPEPLIGQPGGRGWGRPVLPSMEATSAVDSPQTKAPAPMARCRSKLNPVPRMSRRAARTPVPVRSPSSAVRWPADTRPGCR